MASEHQSLLSLIFSLIALVLLCEGTSGSWTLLTPATKPSPRTRHAMSYDYSAGALVMFGGSDTSGAPLNDTWVYAVGSGNWVEITSSVLTPPGRYSMVCGCTNGFFVISTGQSDGTTFYNDIWAFSIATRQWSTFPSNGNSPEPRYGSAGGIYGGSQDVYVALGFSATDRYFDVYRYNIVEERWYLEFDGVHPYGRGYPHARCLMGGTMLSSHELVFHGGCLTGGGTGGPCPAGDSWMYDAETREWTMFDYCASPRIYNVMGMIVGPNAERRVVMYGGQERTAQVISTREAPADQITVLNPDAKSNQWTLKKVSGNDVPPKTSRLAMTGADDGFYMFGGQTSNGLSNDLWFLNASVGVLDELPESEGCGGFFSNYILVHGIFMFLSWGLLLQAGAIIARYGKKWAPMWFHLHRICQVSGLVIALIGFFLIFPSLTIGGHFRFAHAIIGLVVMILGILQPINAFKHPKPSADGSKSLKRRLWEILHRLGGRAALILAMINITLGLALAEASNGVWIAWQTYFIWLGSSYLCAEVIRYTYKKLKCEVSDPGAVGKDGESGETVPMS